MVATTEPTLPSFCTCIRNEVQVHQSEGCSVAYLLLFFLHSGLLLFASKPKKYTLFPTWTPEVCKTTAFWAPFRGFGLLSYIPSESRWGSLNRLGLNRLGLNRLGLKAGMPTTAMRSASPRCRSRCRCCSVALGVVVVRHPPSPLSWS